MFHVLTSLWHQVSFQVKTYTTKCNNIIINNTT